MIGAMPDIEGEPITPGHTISHWGQVTIGERFWSRDLRDLYRNISCMASRTFQAERKELLVKMDNTPREYKKCGSCGRDLFAWVISRKDGVCFDCLDKR